MSAKRKKQRGL